MQRNRTNPKAKPRLRALSSRQLTATAGGEEAVVGPVKIGQLGSGGRDVLIGGTGQD